MLVNHEKKIIAVAVPKTGSTSLYHGLMYHLEQKFDLKSGDPAVYHLPGEDIRTILGPAVFDSYFSSGVVRNPYDRLVSLYHDFRDQRGLIKAPDFDSFVLSGLPNHWVNDIHFRPQAYFLCDRSGGCTVSEIYRFEDGVAQILDWIGARCGFEVERVAHARKSDRGPWQGYYGNPDVRRIVQEIYREDFDIFGYARDIA